MTRKETKISRSREVVVHDFKAPRLDSNKYRFLTDVSVVAKVVGNANFPSPQEIPDGVYENLELEAKARLYENLVNGHYKRYNKGGISLTKGIDLNLPLVRFYEFNSEFERGISYKNGNFFPAIKAHGTALGYIERNSISKNRKSPQKNLTQILNELGLNGTNLHDAGNVVSLDFFPDEEERMLHESEEEYERAKFSTSEIRGEHPSSKFLEKEGKFN